MNKINSFFAVPLIAFLITSCSKDNTEPVIIVPPSNGSTLTLNGLIADEAGSSAGNSVYVDLSADAQTAVARIAWDLGFYSGTDFRVILNNTTSAGAKVTTKTSLAEVGQADTLGLTLAITQTNPSSAELAYFDGLDGALNSTVIPAIAASENDNKVIILNRGTGGGIAARPWIKLKITRNNSGYVVQYGTIEQTSNFKTVTVTKDSEYSFKYISLTTGNQVQVEPVKSDWDFVWTYSVYKTTFGAAGTVAYNFSDLIFSNVHSNIEVAEVLVTETLKYDTFTEASLSNEAVVFSKDRDAIGSKWRATTGTVGVKTDRFYIVKDTKANVYKLKFNSFGGTDGGTRGKPVIQYELLK